MGSRSRKASKYVSMLGRSWRRRWKMECVCVEPTTSRGHITPPTASSHARSKEKNALGSTSRKGSYGLPYLTYLTYLLTLLHTGAFSFSIRSGWCKVVCGWSPLRMSTYLHILGKKGSTLFLYLIRCISRSVGTISNKCWLLTADDLIGLILMD